MKRRVPGGGRAGCQVTVSVPSPLLTVLTGGEPAAVHGPPVAVEISKVQVRSVAPARRRMEKPGGLPGTGVPGETSRPPERRGSVAKAYSPRLLVPSVSVSVARP